MRFENILKAYSFHGPDIVATYVDGKPNKKWVRSYSKSSRLSSNSGSLPGIVVSSSV